jgi:hypothetical protein
MTAATPPSTGPLAVGELLWARKAQSDSVVSLGDEVAVRQGCEGKVENGGGDEGLCSPWLPREPERTYCPHNSDEWDVHTPANPAQMWARNARRVVRMRVTIGPGKQAIG